MRPIGLEVKPVSYFAAILVRGGIGGDVERAALLAEQIGQPAKIFFAGTQADLFRQERCTLDIATYTLSH